ncbi:MAG: hypothetical protein ACRDOO_16640, partial [Actinomadura sp.]
MPVRTRGGITLRRAPAPAVSGTTVALGASLVVGWSFLVLLPNLRVPPPQDHLNYLQAAAN